jgi:CRP-like cAMP-binding protein
MDTTLTDDASFRSSMLDSFETTLPHDRVQLRTLLGRTLGGGTAPPSGGIDALVRSAVCERRSPRMRLNARSSDADTVYLVVDGIVRLEYCRSRREAPRILDLFGPGAFVSVSFAHVSGLLHRTHGPVVLARFEPSTLSRELHRLSTETLLHAMADMRRHYLRLLVEQARAWTLLIDGRLAMAIRSMARRFGTSHPLGVRIDVPLTHHDWAALVGSSRANVTRAIGRLRRSGGIVGEGLHLIVRDRRMIEG